MEMKKKTKLKRFPKYRGGGAWYMNENKRIRMMTKTNSYTENQEEMHVQNMTGKSIDS